MLVPTSASSHRPPSLPLTASSMSGRCFPSPSSLLGPTLGVSCRRSCRRRFQRTIEGEISLLPSLSSSSMIASILLRHGAALVTGAIKERSMSNQEGLERRVVTLLLHGEKDSPPCSASLSLSGGESFSSNFTRRKLILPVLFCCRGSQLRTSAVLNPRTRVLLLLVHHNQRSK